MKTSLLFRSLARLSIALVAAASSTVEQTVIKLAALPGRFLAPLAKLDHQRTLPAVHCKFDYHPLLSTCRPANRLAHSHSTMFLGNAHQRPRGSFATGVCFVA